LQFRSSGFFRHASLVLADDRNGCKFFSGFAPEPVARFGSKGENLFLTKQVHLSGSISLTLSATFSMFPCFSWRNNLNGTCIHKKFVG
jgi:hypothetical protein